MPMDRKQKVGLGCGSLILIALIVLFVVNIAVDRVNSGLVELDIKMHALNTSAEELESLIAKQTAEIEELQGLIEALREELRGAARESGTQ